MRRPLTLLLALGALLAACTPTTIGNAPDPGPTRMPDTASPSPGTVTTDRQDRVHPVSIQALIDSAHDGRGLRVVRELGRTDAYVRSLVTYRTGGLTLSGLLVVPHGPGPFPVLVLAHGYIDPDVYVTGRGFERSQDFLGRRGFALLHVDYRNHAASDRDPANDRRLRLGYVQDVVGAARALRRARLPRLDTDRMGLLGRSMGGGVALTVAVVRPAVFDAIAVYASVSSDAVDNFERWIRRPGRMALARTIVARYGEPQENPEFWRRASPRTHFDRVAVPIQVNHGTADETVPFTWAQDTVRALKAAGKDVTFHRYPGEGHAFGAAYAPSMQRTVGFFRSHFD